MADGILEEESSSPHTIRDVIVHYIVAQDTIYPSADSNWTFKPMGEAS